MKALITLTWLALFLTVSLYLFWNLDTESIGGHDRPYHVLKPLR